MIRADIVSIFILHADQCFRAVKRSGCGIQNRLVEHFQTIFPKRPAECTDFFPGLFLRLHIKVFELHLHACIGMFFQQFDQDLQIFARMNHFRQICYTGIDMQGNRPLVEMKRRQESCAQIDEQLLSCQFISFILKNRKRIFLKAERW